MGGHLSRQVKDRCARDARDDDVDDAAEQRADAGTLTTIASHPCALGAAEVDAELELCMHLRDWDPWSAPSAELMSAISALREHDVNRHGKGSRCLLRAAAVEQIVSEAAESEQMPEWMKYHARARYCLQGGRATEWGQQG
jgi:hypothetical protein